MIMLTLLASIALFGATLGMIELGRRIGVRRYREEGEVATKGFSAVEGAIFALLGLMLAFSFSGALARFDDRRKLVVQEANDIGTAWLRIDLLPVEKQAPIRALFRQYLDVRLQAYRDIQSPESARAELSRLGALQQEIWRLALAETPPGVPHPERILVVPALNAMFDSTTAHNEAARLHVPKVIFVMLGALILACALFAGYDMGGHPKLNLLHSVAFALVLCVTVYVIIDLEHPRIGLIKMSDSDAVLVPLRESMN
ncbi:MAG: DUF4239 domain-containing protein [Verrucomicrobiales bacterium]